MEEITRKTLACDSFINKVSGEKLKSLEAKLDKTKNFIDEKRKKFLNNFSNHIEDLKMTTTEKNSFPQLKSSGAIK